MTVENKTTENKEENQNTHRKKGEGGAHRV